VKIAGVKLYSYDGKTFTPNKKKNPVFIFKPKTESIPSIQKYLLEELNRIDQNIKKNIEDRVGKVFCLW
jgi:hypothetical protein